jgi:Ca2+-binding EF-hand superfamily protein
MNPPTLYESTAISIAPPVGLNDGWVLPNSGKDFFRLMESVNAAREAAEADAAEAAAIAAANASAIASVPGAFAQGSSATKRQKRELSSGLMISLTAQEDRMLRRAYDYMQGHAKRKQVEEQLTQARQDMIRLAPLIPAQLRNAKLDSSSLSFKNYVEGDQRTTAEVNMEAYVKTKDMIRMLEDRVRRMEGADHHITVEDIDVILRQLGAPRTTKELEYMIWEVDENLDGEIDFEEFQLTYYRNIIDTSGSEPCFFFHLLEYLTFDGNHKGYIIEDDCMEILFARHGSQKLESELRFLFGKQLRSAGGDGTLSLSGYLAAVLTRTGRRAIVA